MEFASLPEVNIPPHCLRSRVNYGYLTVSRHDLPQFGFDVGGS
jgi:hypothetical protein